MFLRDMILDPEPIKEVLLRFQPSHHRPILPPFETIESVLEAPIKDRVFHQYPPFVAIPARHQFSMPIIDGEQQASTQTSRQSRLARLSRPRSPYLTTWRANPANSQVPQELQLSTIET